MTEVLGTEVSLMFAAGTVDPDTEERTQLSTTWIVRVTRGLELFVVPRELGGQHAHMSFHGDGTCHMKVRTAPDQVDKVHVWRLADPLDGGHLRRLVDICIPAVALATPRRVPLRDEVVLLDPPAPGQQLDVTLLQESPAVDVRTWPGKGAKQSRYVGRITLFTPEHRPLCHYVAVATYRPQAPGYRRFTHAKVESRTGARVPEHLRALVFGFEELDGRDVPSLADVPVGIGDRVA